MIKILIVEDETGIRDSLMKAFTWSELGCDLIGAVDSGIAALEFCVHNHPDIIISDIVMPGIDGLTFLRYIKEKYKNTKFIILTGHRDFDYAKDALNLGAEFFMLKPIDYRELLSALTSLVNTLINESEKKKGETQKSQILHNLMCGKIYRKENVASNIHIILENISSFRIAVLQFDNEQNQDPFKLASLLDFCEKNSGILEDISSIKMDENYLALFIPISGNENVSDTKDYLLQIQNKINNFFQTTLSIGISSAQNGYENLHVAYIQGIKALGKKFFNGINSINIFIEETPYDSKEELTDYHFITTFSDQIREYINLYQEEELLNQTKTLFKQFSDSFQHNVDFLKSSFIILVVMLSRKVLGEKNKRYILFYEKHSNFQNVIRCNFINDLENLFVDIIMDLKNFIDSDNGSHTSIISKVQKYIEENYRQNITLNDVAKNVYLSPAYLSSILTSETGKSFVNILNEVRISHAIELLKNTELKISKIAYNVGFNEPQYFTLTFKKYIGETPRNYRELYLKKL